MPGVPPNAFSELKAKFKNLLSSKKSKKTEDKPAETATNGGAAPTETDTTAEPAAVVAPTEAKATEPAIEAPKVFEEAKPAEPAAESAAQPDRTEATPAIETSAPVVEETKKVDEPAATPAPVAAA